MFLTRFWLGGGKNYPPPPPPQRKDGKNEKNRQAVGLTGLSLSKI